MDAFASPSIRAATPSRAWLRRAEGIVLTLALGLSFMSVPGPASTGLDGSWQEMLVHAHYKGLQFGRDVIFTWGPWGFICSRFHMGALGAVPILLWQTLGQLLLAFCLVHLTWRLAPWRRIAFVAGLVVFHWLFQDTVYFLVIALAGIGPLMRRDASVVQLVLWTLFLGFLAQLKFTYFVVTAAAVISAAACQAARRARPQWITILAGYTVGVIAAWCAAGQSLDNLYPYVRRSLEISSGYADAMGVDESWTTFGWGAAIALLCCAFCRSVWRSVPEKALGRASAVFLFFILFVMWKEAYTRADYVTLGGHIFGLIGLVAILVPAAMGLLFASRGPRGFDAVAIVCLLAVKFIDPAYYSQVLRVEWERLYGNAVALGHLSSLPDDWQGQYEAAAGAASLPRVKAAVGTGTTDVYDYPTGVALLNGLNLSARPIFQSYSAYTPSLEGWNLRFYQSERAPDFLLWNDGRIDERYPGEDDAALVAALPGHYAPVLSESGFFLFRRDSRLPVAPPERRLLLKTKVHLGESVSLPVLVRSAIWLEADAVPNALGDARALLYKPAQLQILTTDDLGLERTWRLLPRVARAGFLLVPTLEHDKDLVALMQGETTSWVSKFRFMAPGSEDEFWSHVNVSVFTLPSLPLAALPSERLRDLGIADRKPVSVEAAAEQEVIDIPEGKALFLHAPGKIAFDVPKGATRFSGSFGLRAGAYTDGGQTDGVAFEVDAVWPSGRTEKLWGRYLDPFSREGDRGTQHFSVDLPADAPSGVVLREGSGPMSDNRWDWSYVTALHFEPEAPQ